ncbi:RBBP9/YdeN family alpha/beta hydrolase [Sulfurimonas marina]|uniref:Serine hydrolase family protein n=1 Tax=Sulfurimonas marina TaxID=2590551 RepID=A0A7M1AXN2_9BACT|nr:alpha/beta hydrolase [Sulfurimonas marina]QOP42219.1 serine hydrolase family protein [Sulfurimonas marina]
MYKKVLLLHGWGGSDFPHWQSWLASEIAKEYGCVNFLKFSDFDAPKLEKWRIEALQAIKEFKPDIVICHSLANTLWFHLCNQGLTSTVKHLYLVAPPSLNCEIQELQEFFPVSVPNKLYAEDTTLIYSTNDPYMKIEEAETLQKELDVRTIVLHNAGHINTHSNFGKWEWILEDVQEKIKETF